MLTIVGSAYEVILERRMARDEKKRQISHGNNNEGDSKVDFSLDKMCVMEKMRNNNANDREETEDKRDLLFKGKRDANFIGIV